MKLNYKKINFTNGLKMHICEAGVKKSSTSSNILFLHGFPELSYSFRHLIKKLSNKGFYCIAPDQRGYGQTTYNTYNEKSLSKFSVINLSKDIFVLLKNLNIKKVNVIGHDFGSYIACYFTLLYPNMVNSLITMSMPFGGPPSKSSKFGSYTVQDINKNLSKLSPPRKHYQKYFASKSALNNIKNCKQGMFNFLKAYFFYKSIDYKKNKPHKLSSFSASQLSKMPTYYIMLRSLGIVETVQKIVPKNNYQLSWISDKELEIYANSFKKIDIQGPLNWYKVMISLKERKKIINLKLSQSIKIPSLFIAGEADWGPYQKPGELEKMETKFFKNFYGIKIISNAGHWVQQENTKDCMKAIINFYKKVKITYIQ